MLFVMDMVINFLVLLGTQLMLPQKLSGHYSEKVDVWGAGVLLHALLVGVLPFQGDSLEVVFEVIKKVELDFHSGMWESISELARDLIGRMLSRDVSTRMTAGHPSVLFYTNSPSKDLPIRVSWKHWFDTQNSFTGKCDYQWFFIFGKFEQEDEEQDECGFVDALTAKWFLTVPLASPC